MEVHAILEELENVNSAHRMLQDTPRGPPPPELIALLKYVADLTHKLYILQWQFFAQYCILFLLSTFLIVYLRHKQQVALLGDASAARKVLLPAYLPLLKFVALVSLTFVAFFAFVLANDVYPGIYGNAVGEGFALGRNLIALVTIIFMCQKSVSIPALRRAIALSVILAGYPIPILVYMESIPESVSTNDRRTFVYVTRGALCCLYLALMYSPPARASRRALREYCVFSVVYLSFVYVYQELFRARDNTAALNTVLAAGIVNCLYPFFIWRVLKADTNYWRGMGKRAVSLQAVLRSKKRMNERISSEGLHLMIEMHRKYILDFAYLDLVQPIGAGATATVFKGILKNKTQVAVKVYTPPELTEETVAEFSNEAALCAALQHPNIVKFYGLCVCPPNICLVSELCCGNLEEVLEAAPRRANDRLQQCINLGYMIDAARSLAYLHSFTPPFLHRDIKPSNYLVDMNGVVKLTDFGESRVLPNYNSNGSSSSSKAGNNSPQVALDIIEGTALTPKGSYYPLKELNEEGHAEAAAAPAWGGSSKPAPEGKCMTVRGTLDYMAPELMAGTAGKASYAEKADVYSLGISMWEILHPGTEKYPNLDGSGSTSSHLRIYEWVQAGRRPAFNPEHNIHPRLRAMIENCWHQDVTLRPSARNVVYFLEELQEELNAPFASQLLMEIPLQRKTWKGSTFSNIFSGEEAISHMIEGEYVDTRPEAIRLGNALMDAGLIHHTKHARPFEASQAMYFFEDQKIEDCLPLNQHCPEGNMDNSDTSSVHRTKNVTSKSVASSRREASGTTIAASSMAASTAYSNGTRGCPCRKLSQGFDRPKPKKKHKLLNRKSNLNADNFITTKLLPDKSLLSSSCTMNSSGSSSGFQTNEFRGF